MSECRWNFPNNGGGQIRGVADAGIETFNGDLLGSLARETCQNSLDALADGEDIVKVEIKNYVMPIDYIPEYNELLKTFEKLFDYWHNSSDKAREFLENALDLLESSQFNVLRISDYNTTGLLEPYKPTLKSIWNSMTKIDGGGNKSNDKNGGFGIGKNAPYANSLLRTVFYRTLNKDNEYAAQGIARLLSYPENASKEMETMTSGFGYYGNPSLNMPVNAIQELDKIHKRTEIGTDLFIYGFNKNISKNWEKDIIVEILNNFLISIYDGKLIVKVEDEILSKDTLPEVIDKYIKTSINKKMDYKTCYSNYLILTSDKKQIFTKEFHNLGKLKLSVLVDPSLDLDKRILRTRKSGMKLFARTGISRVISFSGILELEGEKLKEYFKELEPPTHDKWESDRHTKNPYEAKEYLDEISKWEQEIIWKLGEFSNMDEVDVEGLSDVLSAKENFEGTNSTDNKETIDYKLGEIEIIQMPKKVNVKGTFNGTKGKDKGGTKEAKKGRVDDSKGEDGTVRILVGEKPRKKRKKHLGVVDENGKDTVNTTKNNSDKCPLTKVRIFKVNRNMYQVLFVIPYSIKAGHIEICSIGENNKINKLSILSAHEVNNCNNVKVSNNNINFDGIIGETKAIVKFELKDSRNYAMEVNVYEH